MLNFNTKQKNEKYASALPGTALERRENRCIAKALANVPQGASMLYLPCGNGWLLPLFKTLGYKITAADSSVFMAARARYYGGQFRENCIDEADNFHVADIFETSFGDNYFDAVVCNHLFHHFSEAEVRQQALRELRRICTGPIIVSFFCTIAIEAVEFYVNKLLSTTRNESSIINYKTFAKDAQKAGLAVERWMPMRPLISKQWYAVLKRCGQRLILQDDGRRKIPSKQPDSYECG